MADYGEMAPTAQPNIAETSAENNLLEGFAKAVVEPYD